MPMAWLAAYVVVIPRRSLCSSVVVCRCKCSLPCSGPAPGGPGDVAGERSEHVAVDGVNRIMGACASDSCQCAERGVDERPGRENVTVREPRSVVAGPVGHHTTGFADDQRARG